MTYRQLVEFLKQRNFPGHRLESWPPDMVVKALVEARKKQEHRVTWGFLGMREFYDGGWVVGGSEEWQDDMRSSGYKIILKPNGRIVRSAYGLGRRGEIVEPSRPILPSELEKLRSIGKI